ncbi:MAG: protein-export chaperone SecB, partial [Gammaproteobacteria bacterium]|nr:protein-export chaperone SecB [Gammaproteobacteria bacterium]
IGDGGFPPLYLAPMNFEAMYLQQQAGVANEN